MIKKLKAIAIAVWTSAASFSVLMHRRLRKDPEVLSETPLMSTAELSEAFVPLKNEFEFLSSGGYRNHHNRWRPPLYFEDSAICRKKEHSTCHQCVLLTFVPEQFKSEVTPCRKIPLKQTGETLEDLYRTATNDEIEAAIGDWLHSVISSLKPRASADGKRLSEDAA